MSVGLEISQQLAEIFSAELGQVQREKALDLLVYKVNLQRAKNSDAQFQAFLPFIRRLIETYRLKIATNGKLVAVTDDPDGRYAMTLLTAGSSWFVGFGPIEILIGVATSAAPQ